MLEKLFKKIINIFERGLRKFLFTKGFDLFERLGVHILPVHYYSPIPDTRILRKKEDLWSRELPLFGIDLNVEGQKRLLETICPPFRDEYLSFPREKTDNSLQYYLNNDSFGFVSGQMHYCIVRYFKPKRIIEVGAGYSTLVSLAALDKNGKEGHPCEFIAIEPYPPQFLENRTLGIKQLIKQKVEDIDVSFFESLSENDLLFIDSTHTVKIGGDVNFLILEVLPKLNKGVIVHIHDIQFPYEYFNSYLLQNHYFWQEQYLVQGFLMYNRSFKVLWCASYMHHKYPELMTKYFSPYPPNRVPTSLYIQKVR